MLGPSRVQLNDEYSSIINSFFKSAYQISQAKKLVPSPTNISQTVTLIEQLQLVSQVHLSIKSQQLESQMEQQQTSLQSYSKLNAAVSSLCRAHGVNASSAELQLKQLGLFIQNLLEGEEMTKSQVCETKMEELSF